MDLKDLNTVEKAEVGADMELEHPATGEVLEHKNKPFVITLAGTDSIAYRRKAKGFSNQRLSKMARGKRPDLTVSDDEACELLAECTLGWKNIILGGKELEFSQKAAADLYSDYPWIREQVDAFVGDRANFFTVA